MTSDLGLHSRVKQNPAVLSADIGDVVVLLHVDRNAYFDTDAVGASVWRQLVSVTEVSELCRRLEDEYEVDRSACESDVLAFLTEAVREGVVVVDPA